MSTKETIGKKWCRRFKKFVKWSSLLIAGALIAGYGYMRYDFVKRADQLESEIATAKSYGFPLETSDMQRLSAVPAEQNAAPKYKAIAEEMKRISGGEEWQSLLDPGVLSREPECREAFRPYLAKMKPVLVKLRDASTLSECAFDRNWSEGWNVLFPELAPMKSFIKWLCAEAQMSALDGDWKLANENIAAMGRIARHSGRDPILIGCLVQVAIEAITYRQAGQLADMANGDVEKLAQLRETVRNMPDAPSFEPYLAGEAFYGYYTMRNLGRFAAEPGFFGSYGDEGSNNLLQKWRVFPPLIETDLVERANAADTLRYWNFVFRKIREDKLDPKALGREMDSYAMQMTESSKPWSGMVEMTLPVFAQAGLSLPRSDTTKAATLGLIDVLIYRSRHQALPATLQAAGAATADSYGDGKLRLVRTERGFRVYSIGPDLRDGGGRLRFERPGKVGKGLTQMNDDQNEPQRDDVVVCYPASDYGDGSRFEWSKKNYLETIQRIEAKRARQAAIERSPPPTPGRYVQ